MAEEVITQQVVDETFPHGVAVFADEFHPVFDVVLLEVKEHEGEVYALGWTAPNKDFIFKITAPTETEHGWWVQTYEGEPRFWTPLPAERGKSMKSALEES